MNLKLVDDELIEIIRSVAPGTLLREALDNILRARTGALLVFSDGQEAQDVVDGGITINAEFSPSLLYELAKMDGAIILDREGKRIIHANAQLVPDVHIPSFETGIRHRTAERFARQMNAMVIAISQRRNTITLYKGPRRHIVRDIAYVLAKADQAVQTLDKYRVSFNNALFYLTSLEFSPHFHFGSCIASMCMIVGEKVHVIDRSPTRSLLLRESDRMRWSKPDQPITGLYPEKKKSCLCGETQK
jgi:diadenylate cyclase